MQLYDEQWRPVKLAGLFFIVDDQGADDAGDPSAEGEEKDDEEWSATFVNNRQRRE